jgi:hypothetical protein
MVEATGLTDSMSWHPITPYYRRWPRITAWTATPGTGWDRLTRRSSAVLSIHRERTVSTASSRRLPGKQHTTKSMLPITQETQGTGEEEEITPRTPAGDTALKTAPVTIIVITPLQRKNGQQPGQPCLITRRSLRYFGWNPQCLLFHLG